MNSRFNFNEKLDFSDIDLTAPEKVIEENFITITRRNKWYYSK